MINDIPGEDMVGAWWHRLDGKVRVSLGDWSETPSREVHEKLERILGDARVEVDAEIGAPAGPDWEKLAGPKTSRGRLMALIADPDYFKDRPGLPDTPKVVAEIRRAIRRLPPLMPGYGDVYYNPEERKVYVVCGDSDEREVIDSWRRRLTAIDGIDAYDGESEHVRPEVGTLRAAKPPWVKVAGLKAREPRQEAKVFTAAVDLDGTIYAYDTWKGEDHFGKLRPGVLKALREFQRRGWRIIIFTTRGNTAKVKQRLNADDVPFDYINENPDQPEGTSCKVIADIYIDDRAVDASMSWERVVDAVDRKFRKAAAAPPPALIDAIVAEELKRDAAVPLPPRKLMPPAPLARSPLFDPSPEVFNDATMNALVHEQMLPDGDPFPLPEVSDAEKAAALLANNAAMVTALLPSRIPTPRPAPVRRRPNRRPAADLLAAQQEAANVDALIPMLRARRARPGLLLKQALDPIADFAPGLPRKDAYGDLSKLTPGQLLTYVLQYHRAHRAGCFASGAPVIMADGSCKAIQAIKPGDAVSVPGGIACVERLWDNGIGFEWFEVSVGLDHFLVTPDHRFLVAGLGMLPIRCLEGYECHVDSFGRIHPASEALLHLRQALQRTLGTDTDLRTFLPHQAGTSAQWPAAAARDHRDGEGIEEDKDGDVLGGQEGCSVSVAGRSRLVVSSLLGGRAESRRDRRRIGRFADVDHERISPSWDSAANGEVSPEQNQAVRREQLSLERWDLQWPADGLCRLQSSTIEVAPEIDRRTGREMRMVSAKEYAHRDASSDPVPVLSASRGCNLALQEMSQSGRPTIPGTGWRSLRIRRLPGFPRRRYDLEVSHPSHCYRIAGCVVHNSHHDLRFGSPEMGLHSWAVPRGLPPPGGKNLAIHQPVHRHRYRKFEGEIPRGQYGAGTVKKVDEGQVLITKAGPDHIHFTLAHKRHPERYTLLRPRSFGRSRDWLLVNTTPAEKVPFEKLHYRRIPSDRIEDAIRQMEAGSSVEAKVDGASQLVHLLKGHAEHFSYRTSKETNRPIFHTERVFGGRPEIKYPPHLEGSILKGELHAGPISSRPNDRRHAGVGPGTGAGDAGHRSGAFGPQDIATLLNSSVGRSLQLQREQGVKVRNMLYDVGRYGRRPIGPDVPRAERREMLGEFMKHLPADTFHLSEPVHTPAEGIEMLRQIRSGEHPLTQEGVVIHPAQGMPLKGKFTDEHLVHVTGTFPGEGKRSRTVGGFTYGHEPGRTVGRVGSGFSDKFLDEVARDPAAFTGRLARVKAQEKLPSGALRAPVFLGLHEDYNAAPIKAAGTAASRARVLSTIRPGAQPSWVQHVMAHYDSTKPPPGIFTRGADEIVAAGRDPHVAPLGLGSWQKMVIFHRNRGGNRLGEERRDVLQTAIRRLSDEIREGREKAGGLLPSVQLQPQQRRVAERVNAYDPRVLVYHGLGSGKSLASIAAAERSGRPYVAAVPAALRPNYHKELAKFTDLHTPSSVLSYTQVGQGKQPSVNPDTLILDESQRLRNPDSAATRGVMDLAARARRVLMLSGTPIVNNPSDLAVPLSILTGTPVTTREFNKRFVGKQEVSPGFLGRLRGIRPATVPTIAHEQELEDLLRGHVDYQPSRMPEGVRTNEERVVVDMSPPQKDFYRLMWNQLPWTTRWKMRHDYPMTAEELKNLQAFMTGPRQAALSLYPFRADGDALRAFHDSTKLKRAFDDVRTALGKDPRAKVIAYSNFIDAGLTPYAAALKAHGVPYSILHGKLNDAERKAQLDAYNQGKSRVLLIGPSAAEGISAQGTQLIQLLDPHWNEARMGQARGRGLRFDSHEGLPEELRNVAIRRYVARMPDPGFFGRLFGGGPRPTADEFLEAQARRKEDLNEQFRAVLRRVGSEPPTRPWWRVFS